MYVSFEFLSNCLKSKQLNNITINSYMPASSVYARSFACNAFGNTFMANFTGDNYDKYDYDSQFHKQLLAQPLMSFDDYIAALNQFKSIVSTYGLNVDFRSNIDLYNEYVASMKFLPMGGMVSIIDSTYEVVNLNFTVFKMSIPTLFGVKLTMPDFIKIFTLFLPNVVLTVGMAQKIYNSFNESNFTPDTEVGVNGLTVFNDLSTLCNTMDQIINNFFKRDLTKEEVREQLYSSNSQGYSEYINYFKYMLSNYNLSELQSRQALLLGRLSRDSQFKIIKKELGISEVDPNRPIIFADPNDSKIVCERAITMEGNGILSLVL